MNHSCEARDTLTAIELDCGDTLEFKLRSGESRNIELLATDARILFTTLDELKVEQCGARTFYEFTCRLQIDGEQHTLRREVPTQRSFYEPWEIAGLRIWFDAVDDIFDYFTETHGECRPRKQARFAIQDATLGICPERLHPWCPLPKGGMDIMLCYCGEDCWLGPYFGASLHGGLDINHPRGTPIYAPFDLDDQGYWQSVAQGHKNNRWRGRRRWPDGSTWTIGCYHMRRLTVPEHAPVRSGQQIAEGAGVWVGYHDHSHFVFRVRPEGGDQEILLDPWILFWQMYRDAGEAG